jgi:hypothetical protein
LADAVIYWILAQVAQAAQVETCISTEFQQIHTPGSYTLLTSLSDEVGKSLKEL